MANVLYDETAIQDIANAIREKTGSTDHYTVAQMGNAIRSIKTGDGVPLTSFTNVLDLDTTVVVEGYRIANSGYLATEGCKIVAFYAPTMGTYTFRIRGFIPFNSNIFFAKDVTQESTGGVVGNRSFTTGTVDEYGDFLIDITTSSDDRYVCFNLFSLDSDGIITVNEPIGTGNYIIQ